MASILRRSIGLYAAVVVSVFIPKGLRTCAREELFAFCLLVARSLL